MSEKKVCNSTKKYVNNIKKYVTAYGVCQIKPDFSDASEKSGLIWHTPYAVTYFLMLLTYFLVLLHTFFSDILLQVFWHTFDYLLTYLHYVKILLIIFWHTCGMLKYLQLFVDIHSLCWNTFDNMLTYTCYFKNTFDNMLTYTCYVGILFITCWHTRAMLNYYWWYVDIHVLYWAILT